MEIDHKYIRTFATKALLIIWGAVVVLACGDQQSQTQEVIVSSKERLLTELSENITIAMSEGGELSYIFKAPLVEGYTLASEPYREFRKGVEIITFEKPSKGQNRDEEAGEQRDSLSVQSGEMRANYAIYYETRKLWETMGDVVVKNSSGRELYSQQLFWNSQTQRIYSNVDTKIIDTTTGDVYYGEGFESDEQMEDWSFRKMKGRMRVTLKSDESDEQITPIDSLDRDYAEESLKMEN